MQENNHKAIPETIKKILRKRHIVHDADLRDFLFPKLNMLPHPAEMKGIGDASATVCNSLETGSEIIIWGDYDVDGTTGTALLVNFFRELGVEANWHIPNRLAEGYGLNSSVFKEKFAGLTEGEFLLITVDCGISDSEAIEEVKSLGGEVIVSDHHQLPLDSLPDCTILNPCQKDCGFYGEKLAGVGVAFYLAAAVRDRLMKKGFFSGRSTPNMKNYLGFVALGTIADLVEMTSTNRILVRAGMESLVSTSIPGLRAMLDNAGISGGLITTEDVSFGIGPKINAAGRLGKPEAAVDLMTCDNLSAGVMFSKSLDRYNVERKQVCETCLDSALSALGNGDNQGNSALCVAGDYHAGVVGIVASRLVEIYKKPSIVFSRQVSEDGLVTYKGSGRSVEGVSILHCLHESSAAIMKYGGHEMAAGLTVEGDSFEAFKELFDKAVRLSCLNNDHRSCTIDNNVIECTLDEVMDGRFLEYFSLIEPFGPLNEKPVFLDRQALVVNCKAIGSLGQHLQLTFRGKYRNHKAVAFGLGEKLDDVKKQKHRKLYFAPMVNRFRGSVDWRVRVVSL